VQHEPPRQLLRQRGDGSILLVTRKRARGSIRELRCSEDGVFDYVKVFYNQRRWALDARPDQPGGVRAAGVARDRERPCTGEYSSLPRRENVVPGASYEVAPSAIAVPTCRCTPWEPMDDRHRPVVRSASFTVGGLGGILTHALGDRAIAAERLQGVRTTYRDQKGQARRR
jgi:hypothetical protein